jgi:hypothetical protein
MIRRLLQTLARLAAALAVIAIVVIPVAVMLRIAGNPFDPNVLSRLADRRVDDTTIVKLLAVAFLAVWAWVVVPAIRQVHISLAARRPARSSRTVVRHPIEAPADAPGPRSWLARLVRFALTSTLVATATTTSTLAFASPPAAAPSASHPAATVVIDEATDDSVTLTSRPSVAEHIAGPRDTPYAIAAQRFSDRIDEAREEIVALNHGRPTPDGHMWRGGSFPEGMQVLIPTQTPDNEDSPSGGPGPPSAAESDWPAHLPAETIVVEPGDNVWNLAEERLDTVDGPETSPTDSDIAHHVDHVVRSNTFTSGDPNLIFPGETIDFPAIGTPPTNGGQPRSGADDPPTPAQESEPTTADSDDSEPEVATSTAVTGTATTEHAPADPAPSGANEAATESEAAPATVPPAAAPPSHDPTITADDLADVVPEGEATSALLGVTGAVVLASALAAAMTWERRRRRARGVPRSADDAAAELAIVAASDVPFVRWVGQELAALARILDPDQHEAVPLAVELDESEGVEVLWDQPVLDAPPPWEATDGGWSWRTLYDPDEPTPMSDWPSPMPGLVTIGTRSGRQLLLDLEHIGTLSISGQRERVDGLLRSMILELAIGDELSNARVLTVGTDIDADAPGHRVEEVSFNTASSALDRASAAGDRLIGTRETLFQQRLGPNPAIADQITVVILGPDASWAEQAHVATQVASGRGIGVVIAGDDVDAAASILIDADGTASLTGLAERPVRFVASDVPFDTSTAVERVLHPPLSQAASVDTRSLTETLDDAALDAVAMVDAAASEDGGATTTEADLLDCDDEPLPTEPAVLVRVFGRPRIDQHPEISGVSLRLLAFLACQSEPVSLSRIRHVVWGGAARDRKTVSNKLSQLRSTLGTTDDGEPLISLATAEGISVHDSVKTDLRLFDELVAWSEQLSSNAAIGALRDALALVEGEPFDEAGYEWADLGVRMHDRIVEAAARLFELACDTGDLATARYALVQGLQGVPGHEDLYRLRMQLEHRCAGPSAVHGVFNDLTHHLDALDCEPSAETVAVYRQLTGRRTAS